MLNDSEVRQFHEALRSHVEELGSLEGSVGDLCTAMEGVLSSWHLLSDTSRIIINLMAGYGDYGPTGAIDDT